MLSREHDTDLAAQRVAIHHGWLAYNSFEERGDVRDVVAKQIVPRHVSGLAVAAQVGREHMPPLGQGFQKLLAVLPTGAARVQVHEGRAVWGTLREVEGELACIELCFVQQETYCTCTTPAMPSPAGPPCSSQ